MSGWKSRCSRVGRRDAPAGVTNARRGTAATEVDVSSGVPARATFAPQITTRGATRQRLRPSRRGVAGQGKPSSDCRAKSAGLRAHGPKPARPRRRSAASCPARCSPPHRFARRCAPPQRARLTRSRRDHARAVSSGAAPVPTPRLGKLFPSRRANVSRRAVSLIFPAHLAISGVFARYVLEETCPGAIVWPHRWPIRSRSFRGMA